MKREYPAIERLHELLEYKPDSGTFFWKESRGRVKKGAVAGTPSPNGYIFICVDGKPFRAHRLAWAMVYGKYPEQDIDHIDCCKANNAIANLRGVSNAGNQQNQVAAHANNKSGLIGATWHSVRKCWRAQIIVDGKAIHLGTFPTAEAAHAAYVEAKRTMHPMGTL